MAKKPKKKSTKKDRKHPDLLLGVANRIREVRQRRGMSQTDVIKKSGVSPKAYARIENDPQNPTIETLASIAKALDVNVHELIPSAPRVRPSKPLKGFESSRDAIEFAVQVLRSYQSIDES